MMLLGCSDARHAPVRPEPVEVDMEYEAAEPTLAGAGGMYIDVPGIADTDTHIREVRKFPNGSVVLVEVSLGSRKITDLRICVDPNQPTEQWEWKEVRSFVPGSD
jgi:hypothetical protein